MSEPSGLRDLSKMEFYKNAKRIRKNIDLWLIREFGIKKNPRSIRQVARDISEEEQSVINEIYAKYGVNPNKAYNSEYPEWYLEDEKKLIKKYCNMLIFYIVQANKLHPNYDFEWEQRRKNQNDAIGVVQNLYVEIDHIKEMFDVSLKFTTDLMDALDREEDLIKGWRQSDNKRRKEKGSA